MKYMEDPDRLELIGKVQTEIDEIAEWGHVNMPRVFKLLKEDKNGKFIERHYYRKEITNIEDKKNLQFLGTCEVSDHYFDKRITSKHYI